MDAQTRRRERRAETGSGLESSKSPVGWGKRKNQLTALFSSLNRKTEITSRKSTESNRPFSAG